MPFKSEKQRRFLWAEHPDIAKRWAKKYPASNKDLPMYANSDDKSQPKEKAAQINISELLGRFAGGVNSGHPSILSPEVNENCKKADSKQEKVDIPRSEKPVYAGEEREKGMISSSIDTGKNIDGCQGENAINTLLQKISVVLSPAIAQTAENMNAEREGRVPVRVGKNQGIKQYPVATPQIPLPMGMNQPQQPQQPQQSKQTQPASPTPVGAGQSTATTDPIKFHSGLSASGVINGNASLSAPNTVNTKISASGDVIQSWLMGMDHVEPDTMLDILAEERMKSAVEKWAAIGLWDRIRAKKQRGEKPAKPGDKDYPDSKSWQKVTGISEKKSASTPAWQRAAGKNEEGGLNAKGRASYNRATGGNLKAPVTEKNPKGERNKRQNSFCSRMCGMKRVNTGAKTKSDPDSRINKALRKWNCKCGSEKTAGWLAEMFAKSWPNTSWALNHGSPEIAFQTMPLQTALGAAAGAGYGGLTGQGVVRNALRGGLIGTGAGVGGIYGSQVAAGLNADINGPHDDVLNNNSYMVGSTVGTLGGAYGGNQLYNVLERVYDKHREKKKEPEKQAQDFDPAMSRDAENAIMHGTGLVGSTALGTLAGLPVSAGLEQFAKARNWIPDSEKSPFGHNLANSLLKIPMFVGGTLGLSLYDNYILRPHMKRELERKKQEEEVRQQLAMQSMKKQAEASLGRILGTALASTGGGLALGGYPGWKLQRASESAGNSDFTNFIAGKAPIALAGALSAAAYNHLYDQYEKKQKQPPKQPRQEADPAMKYLQYLVH